MFLNIHILFRKVYIYMNDDNRTIDIDMASVNISAASNFLSRVLFSNNLLFRVLLSYLIPHSHQKLNCLKGGVSYFSSVSLSINQE